MTRKWNILLVVSCVLLIAAVTFIVSVKPAATFALKTDQTNQIGSAFSLPLPPLSTNSLSQLEGDGIARHLQLKTNIPDRPSTKIIQYTVKRGDSPSSIARQFNLQPETILWGNEKLNASVGILQIGDVLNILPVDGVLHTVKEGDTLESLESLYGTPKQEIVEYPGNRFDLTRPPQLTQGQQIIVPNGVAPIFWSEARPPGAAQSGSSVSTSSQVPNLGTGYFIWPVNGYSLTQEYWSGHPGLDLATAFRQPIFASDSGTVVFSGWDNTGYGVMVIIDHGNGYQTYYSHNEANLVSVGQTVWKGQQIAESGNTGNSTGNHIDFRILLNGTFLNPFNYLP